MCKSLKTQIVHPYGDMDSKSVDPQNEFKSSFPYRSLDILILIIRGQGGVKWPTANLNDYFSATECPIDLKPSCIFKFFRCLEVYEKKIDLFGPWRDRGVSFIDKGPPKSA